MVDIMVLNEVQEKGATTAPGLALTVSQATQVVKDVTAEMRWQPECGDDLDAFLAAVDGLKAARTKGT